MSLFRKVSLIFALLLVTTTIVFFNYFPRYQLVSANLLKNPEFSAAQQDWSIATSGVVIGDKGLVTLTVAPGDAPVNFSQTINVSPNSLVQVSCDFKEDGIVRGINLWDTARVLLLALDKDGKPLYDRPHVVVMQSGSSDWQPISTVFMLDQDIKQVQLILQLRAKQGTMSVKALALHEVLVTPAFTNIRQWLLITWLVCGSLAVARLVLKHIKNKSQALVGIILLCLWIGILLPTSIKNQISGKTVTGEHASEYQSLLPRPELQRFSFKLCTPVWDQFKIGHLLLFGVLAYLLASRNTYHFHYLRIIGLLSVFALVTEITQLFIPGRTPNLTDIFIDLSGALLGLMLNASLVGCWSRLTKQKA